jgi:hypothetical protein
VRCNDGKGGFPGQKSREFIPFEANGRQVGEEICEIRLDRTPLFLCIIKYDDDHQHLSQSVWCILFYCAMHGQEYNDHGRQMNVLLGNKQTKQKRMISL